MTHEILRTMPLLVLQVVMTSMLAGVQLIGSLIWLFVVPPGSRHDYPTRDQVVLTCNVPDHHFLYSLAYDGILIIACTVYAVKTRKNLSLIDEPLPRKAKVKQAVETGSFGKVMITSKNALQQQFGLPGIVQVNIASLCHQDERTGPEVIEAREHLPPNP
ncbi:hypothetical protein ANCCEY_14765 [Ancylostoma ceylanicum]|uniref:G-protein coupled receptors family 3 profile domain-containing protein n=1 Tax=Ancylostoma ceylanicum TaxID=53326 RepID=A0A0D6L5Y3_9BILA|nr:hypothetical protein ANCCEY_14765 [Ancylostoma ceylanicum]